MAAIGRANPIGSINEWQKHESNMATQQQNRAVQDLNMVNIKQTNQENQMKLDAKKQEQAELSKEIPWEVVSMGFEGGDEEGSPSALINKVATGLGIIDMSQGGAGTINGKRGQKLAAFMSQPQMLHKMSRTRVNWTRGNFVKAQQALAEKPTDKNLQAAFEKATIDYKDATSQGKAFDNLFKEQKQTQEIPQEAPETVAQPAATPEAPAQPAETEEVPKLPDQPEGIEEATQPEQAQSAEPAKEEPIEQPAEPVAEPDQEQPAELAL